MCSGQAEEKEPVSETEREPPVRQQETNRMLCPGCQLHKGFPGGKNDE